MEKKSKKEIIAREIVLLPSNVCQAIAKCHCLPAHHLHNVFKGMTKTNLNYVHII